ncbi:TRAP transporter small permease [Sinanaerobacter chloroacetimidivorans]|uniref:TRAP transporter small permease subunit n=1 Tax=Sinanaerobacter chloroacetimidivorans TaxID=2818044 RepID=A0A8J7VZ72_9FIRM|nr:TRAP transporter small permease subunit [Sinanaerobacter chloroacetimidivorans]MBR0597837.1 TRAP transporter small permease subunit [Sinanaerobacter chloroacetimidivorans]
MERNNKIAAISAAICFLEKNITVIFFFLMLCLLMIQVICRYYLHLPLAWVEEMIRYIYIGVGFLGAAVAVKERGHIEINILPSILKGILKSNHKVRKVLMFTDVIVYIIGTGFWTYIVYTMTHYMLEVKAQNQLSVAMEIPMWIIVAIIVISSILCAFHYLFNLILIFHLQKTLDTGEEEVLKQHE